MFKNKFLLITILIIIFIYTGCGESSSAVVSSKKSEFLVDDTTNLIWIDDCSTNTITKTLSQAQDYCDNLSVGENSDWRVPSLKELFTIVDVKSHNPSIKDNFKYTTPLAYWSSDSYPLDNTIGMGVNFYDGSDGLSNKDTPRYIRCVSGESLASASFTKTSNDTVAQDIPNLEWQDNSEVKDNYFTYEEALTYCDSLDVANHNDWRIPTIKELRYIVDNHRINPAINQTFSNTSNNFFYSSTPYKADTSKVWTLFFRDGSDYQNVKTDKINVRCVRGE